MGTSNNRGKGHWTESSNVLMDSLRMSTRPMPQHKPVQTPDLVDIQQEQQHMSVTGGEKQVPLGGGFSFGVEGPNAHGGYKSTDEVTRLDSQVNLGGVSVSHKSPGHHYRFGVNKGWGGGVRVHHDQPGFGGDIGPFSFDVKDERLKEMSFPSVFEDPFSGSKVND